MKHSPNVGDPGVPPTLGHPLGRIVLRIRWNRPAGRSYDSYERVRRTPWEQVLPRLLTVGVGPPKHGTTCCRSGWRLIQYSKDDVVAGPEFAKSEYDHGEPQHPEGAEEPRAPRAALTARSRPVNSAPPVPAVDTARIERKVSRSRIFGDFVRRTSPSLLWSRTWPTGE